MPLKQAILCCTLLHFSNQNKQISLQPQRIVDILCYLDYKTTDQKQQITKAHKNAYSRNAYSDLQASKNTRSDPL